MAKPLIDWEDSKSHVWINPQSPLEVAAKLQSCVAPHQHLHGHIWLASSGTEHFPKMIALSKRAFLVSAEAVNAHFGISKEDSWLNVLPLFHAGGLGPHARAHLTGSTIYDFSEEKWDPCKYVERLTRFNIAMTSLTPTHVYDLIHNDLRPPTSLRAVIVGGSALSDELHRKGCALGWPLHRSYGMTETCSQIATAPEPNQQAIPLKHIRIRFDADDFIEIQSNALLTGFVRGDDPEKLLIDPKVDGWYKTQDKGRLQNGIFEVFGRGSHFLKIAGENTNFADLQKIWEAIRSKHRCQHDAVLIDLPDERIGRKICLAVTATSPEAPYWEPLLDDFSKNVLPIAKIRAVYRVESIPRTNLFKVKNEALRNIILKEA